jgi:hypothetical protein
MMPGKKCVMFHFFSFFHDGWRSRKVKKSLFRPLLSSAGHNNDATTTKKDVKTGETTTTVIRRLAKGKKTKKL